MIRLKRINGTDFVLNCDQIKYLESTPDTMITLLSGEKLLVRDSIDSVIDATTIYKKRIYQEPPSKGEWSAEPPKR
jgi:flagellar protein FlbD